jgi:Ca-activated chloride channel family protein
MRGDKLRYVQQAAQHVLGLLDERDRLAIVAYDDNVSLVAPSQFVTEQNRGDIAARIDGLQPGGWTDLSGGWLEGCRQVAAHQDPTTICRALVLTDGLANRGITDVEELIHHARELCRRGVATSTFGVGLDFNEHLLEALATEGGGHFYYIERPSQIPDMFRDELGQLQTVIAREAVLSINVPKGVNMDVLGELPHEREHDRIRIFLGDIFAGEQRAVYINVQTPPDTVGTTIFLKGELGYAGLSGSIRMTEGELVLTYRREAEVARLPLNDELLRRLGNVDVATAATRALRLERQGLRQQAQAILDQSLAANAAYLASDKAQSYQQLSKQMNDELSEEQRKTSHFAAYRARRERS